ncbi:MAG: carboxypeptidase M32 [Spirochaetaceae bacterium]|jgi:carboxypeptidase Taq|nr:carboxypeptidase M32 [Spirochaetaceae bacterium]
MNGDLARLHALDSERMHLSRAAAALQWDQETCLPPLGVEDRAEQLAVVEGLAHEKLVNPEIGELLDRLGFKPDAAVNTGAVANAAGAATAGTGPDTAVNAAGVLAGSNLPALERDFVRVLDRDYRRAVQLPPDFVRECARTEGLAQAAWAETRKNSDFAAFVPHLERLIALARQKAGYWGWGGPAVSGGRPNSAYDGLLDFHEPGLGAERIAALFGPLRERLSALLAKIAAAPQPEDAFLHRRYDVRQQDAFCREVLAGLGFDSRRARLDRSAHPFTTTLGFNDVRITTRYQETDPLSGLFSVIHEGGHAFYELSLDPALRSSCLAEGVSMGIHESQSRLWENVIGRSRAFWRGWFPRFKTYFASPLEGVDVEQFYRAVNRVFPLPVRVEADEVSYSLHVILRFELEQRLFDGTLTVRELPEAWNAAMKKYLGLEPKDDAEGVLQDVHWSMGAFGYFPSYVLGNLYGLQFWEKLREAVPDTGAALEKRDYGAVHTWLREKIHCFGRRLSPGELLLRVTGKELSADPFVRYLEEKYADLYGI